MPNIMLSREQLEQASIYAKGLKATLEERLMGAKKHYSTCTCRRHIEVNGKVVAVNAPEKTTELGQFSKWTFESVNGSGRPAKGSISDMVPQTELYPLFRRIFRGLPLIQDHPTAQLCNGNFNHCQSLIDEIGRFNPSDATISLSYESPLAYVRPAYNTSSAVWTNAQFSLSEASQGILPEVKCTIDFDAPAQSPSKTQAWCPDFRSDDRCGFNMLIPKHNGHDLRVPIARVLSWTGKRVWLQLDANVCEYSV